MALSNGTNNPAAENWGITDQVTHLGILGSDVVYPLSELGGEPTLGASAECAIKIDDPSKQVSRLHARLMRTHETWLVLDLSSKNGIHIDGVQQPAGVLAPGTELGIGGVVLVAESVQLSALRGFLARLLGWGDDRRVQVDGPCAPYAPRPPVWFHWSFLDEASWSPSRRRCTPTRSGVTSPSSSATAAAEK